MRLQLTVWAEDLPNASIFASSPDAFAVVTLLTSEPGEKPTLLGQTEVVAKSNSPDWTQAFTIEEFELGKSTRLVVSIYDYAKTKKYPLGSTLFEVGEILGAPGCIMGKELKDGGLIVTHVETASNYGRMKLQLRALGLANTDGMGLLNKSDPFFELQRIRRSIRTGAQVWDTVFRSKHIDNNLNPVWGESHLDVAALCGGNRNQKIRVAVFDHESNGKHEFMGYVDASVNEFIDLVNDTALSDVERIDRGKSMKLMKHGKEVGIILVVRAEVTGAPKEDSEAVEIELEDLPPPHEEDIKVQGDIEETEVEFVPESDELATIKPTFVNFIAGGCELRAAIAVDSTAANGDPRSESSLHYFKDGGRNSYEQALFSVCSVLSQYDSDRQYPVYGFGAKRDGTVKHAFSLGSGSEVDGVSGIIQAYNDTFRSGIIMSQPRDFSEVIAVACEDAKVRSETKQSYSVLLIFTSGAPSDSTSTIKALEKMDSAPLSIVIVGVGPGDFSGMQALLETKGRDKVRFVAFAGDRHELAEAALDHIPGQLEAYFTSHNISPQPECIVEEIVVQPYSPADDVAVPIDIDPSSGHATVSGPAVDPASNASTVDEMAKFFNKVKKHSHNMFKGQVRREFRKLQKRANREAQKLVKKIVF